MGKRAKGEYDILTIAMVTGQGYRTVLAHEKRGEFEYGDFRSVVAYCVKRRGERDD
jgi:hypothetical protein